MRVGSKTDFRQLVNTLGRAGNQTLQLSVRGPEGNKVKTFYSNSTWGKIKDWFLNSKAERIESQYAAARHFLDKAEEVYGKTVCKKASVEWGSSWAFEQTCKIRMTGDDAVRLVAELDKAFGAEIDKTLKEAEKSGKKIMGELQNEVENAKSGGYRKIAKDTKELLDASEIEMLDAQKAVDKQTGEVAKKERQLSAASETLKALETKRDKTLEKVDKMLQRFNHHVEPFATVKYEGGKLHGSFDLGDGRIRFNIGKPRDCTELMQKDIEKCPGGKDIYLGVMWSKSENEFVPDTRPGFIWDPSTKKHVQNVFVGDAEEVRLESLYGFPPSSIYSALDQSNVKKPLQEVLNLLNAQYSFNETAIPVEKAKADQATAQRKLATEKTKLAQKQKYLETCKSKAQSADSGLGVDAYSADLRMVSVEHLAIKKFSGKYGGSAAPVTVKSLDPEARKALVTKIITNIEAKLALHSRLSVSTATMEQQETLTGFSGRMNGGQLSAEEIKKAREAMEKVAGSRELFDTV